MASWPRSSRAVPRPIKLLLLVSAVVTYSAVDAQSQVKSISIDNLRSSRRVSSLAYSNCSKLLAAGRGETLEVYNAQTQELLYSIKQETTRHITSGFENRLNSLAFSPDDKFLAAGRGDGVVLVYDTATFELLRTLHHVKRPRFTPYLRWQAIRSVRFSPKGSCLASGAEDGRIMLWDTDSWKSKIAFDCKRQVLSLAFSPHGKHFAAGLYGDTKSLQLWDLESGSQIHSWDFRPRVKTVAYLLDGRGVIAGAGDVICLIDPAALVKLREATVGPISLATVWPMSDNKRVLSMTTGGMLAVRDVSTLGILASKQLREPNWSLFVLSPDEKTIVAGGSRVLFLPFDSLEMAAPTEIPAR